VEEGEGIREGRKETISNNMNKENNFIKTIKVCYSGFDSG